ncbi:hypothetical protein B7R54_03795 [Subtercola boreus]|uniref:Uncharacterized protein n=1 Tax=Subtercola boreus TaxID=120213 RepID=A0A3E0VEV5_9MICO|nr:hypothetical protein [Subtercola boreus]RFA08442.1 hypothetical protein B7R54_03795 [Subtercola boreus]TQL54641.1 hypothetical protein FB464_2183 [Subtercola boreus]
MPEEIADNRADDQATRISELEGERDRLQAELDTVRNRALDRWLSVEQYESVAVASLQQTLSWKVTSPLRAVRSVQLKRRPAGGGGSSHR